jgi:hypothetical protein
VGTAGYFWVHAGHRETATTHAILVIQDSAARELADYADDPIIAGLSAPIGSWVVETLIQGAWMREYHEWEKATKRYFDGHHERNGSTKPDWKGKVPGIAGAASHVDRVRAQLALFGASPPEASIAILDKHRRLINAAKHEEEYFATEQDYRDLVSAISQFWNDLAPQEEFTLKAHLPPPMPVPQFKK